MHNVHITAVILAAGQSKRMGEAKLLLPWGETTILGQTIENVLASSANDVLLVTGGYRERVAAVAQAYGVPTVHNPDFAEGEMLSSLKVAVNQCVSSGDEVQLPLGVLVVLGDLPFLPTAILDTVMAAFRAGLGEIVAPAFKGRRGHPVLIGRHLFDALLTLPSDGAPRDLIRQHPDKLHQVEVDSDVILRDVDTPEQYARWRPMPHNQ